MDSLHKWKQQFLALDAVVMLCGPTFYPYNFAYKRVEFIIRVMLLLL